MSKRSAQSGSAGMSARQRQDMRAKELLEQAQNKETQTVVFMDISIDGDPLAVGSSSTRGRRRSPRRTLDHSA